MKTTAIILGAVIIFLLILLFVIPAPQRAVNQSVNQPDATQATTTASVLIAPIADALSRVTKKPFGIYITPQTSPVQPERFTGYHTGVDFETTAAEQNQDVRITAACDGKLVLKERASGYGGVAVESCVLSGEPVTVIYGHLRLASITASIGETLHAGDFLAVLGIGYSAETDGERKHLHFGIHKGTSIDIRGYVANKVDLVGWLDPTLYLP